MELNKKLQIKYLTGMYKICCDKMDPVGTVISIVEELRRSKKTKKIWKKSDILFSEDIIFSALSIEENDKKETINSLFELGVIIQNGNLLSIKEDLLDKTYNF